MWQRGSEGFLEEQFSNPRPGKQIMDFLVLDVWCRVERRTLRPEAMMISALAELTYANQKQRRK